jgi:hypothetical protein
LFDASRLLINFTSSQIQSKDENVFVVFLLGFSSFYFSKVFWFFVPNLYGWLQGCKIELIYFLFSIVGLRIASSSISMYASVRV